MRVPGIAWMPSRIKHGVTSQLAHAMDVFPTALVLAGASLPKDVVFDGVDLAPLLFESRPLPERPFFYYRGDQLFACRLVNGRLISRLKQVMEVQNPNDMNQNCSFISVTILPRNAMSPPHIPRFSLVFRKL